MVLMAVVGAMGLWGRAWVRLQVLRIRVLGLLGQARSLVLVWRLWFLDCRGRA